MNQTTPQKPVQNPDREYFGRREEDGVIAYRLSDSPRERNLIVRHILHKPFKVMISSIMRRYPIYVGNHDSETLEAQALSHLVENMVKFDKYILEHRPAGSTEKWNKHKQYRYNQPESAQAQLDSLSGDTANEWRRFDAAAFAYCGTIVRNYFKDHSKRTYDYERSIVPFVACADDNYRHVFDEVHRNPDYVTETVIEETDHVGELLSRTVAGIRHQIESDLSLRENEIRIGNAIIRVLENRTVLLDGLDYQKKITSNFTKQHVLLMLQDATGMSTKEIRNSMKRYKDMYALIKSDLNAEEEL